jgi:hypothetical protein
MKMKFRIIFSLIICCVITASSEEKKYTIQYENPSARGVVTQETFNELIERTYNIISFVEEINTEKIISLWPDPKVLNEVLIDPVNDFYVTKKGLINDFKRKGQIYAMYFDSERNYLLNKKSYDLNYNEKSKMDMKLCLRDVLIKYKCNNIRIEHIKVVYSDLIEIYLTWDDKDKSESAKISYSVSYSKKNKKWVLCEFLSKMPY